MALPPGRPVTDPLLVPEIGLREPMPARAPVGNSIRTLLLIGVLALVGIAVWWARRPSDLTQRIGGREWVIVDVDGEPAVNELGTASSFVLDGVGEIRMEAGCNTATGRWSFDVSAQRLLVEGLRTTAMSCPDDVPATYAVGNGRVGLDGSVMTVATDDGEVRAISHGDLQVAASDEIAGRWTSGSSTVEIGPRGLLRVDDCTGSWVATGAGITALFDEQELSRDGCDPAPIWTSGVVLLPVRFEDSVFLSRDGNSFPLDRMIHRLDAAPETGSPLLDGP
jgi:hypothetical protein